MKVVGITGRSGCGKSSATNFLREKGYPCIDADLVAREVLLPGSPCIAQLQQVFGADIADENGTVRRRLLAGIVPDHAKCFRHRRSPRFDLRHTMPGRVYLCLLPSPSGEGGPQGRMRAECALLPIRGQLRRLCPHQSLSATASPEGEAPARKKGTHLFLKDGCLFTQ